jgi:hypothetical protein
MEQAIIHQPLLNNGSVNNVRCYAIAATVALAATGELGGT